MRTRYKAHPKLPVLGAGLTVLGNGFPGRRVGAALARMRLLPLYLFELAGADQPGHSVDHWCFSVEAQEAAWCSYCPCRRLLRQCQTTSLSAASIKAARDALPAEKVPQREEVNYFIDLVTYVILRSVIFLLVRSDKTPRSKLCK